VTAVEVAPKDEQEEKEATEDKTAAPGVTAVREPEIIQGVEKKGSGNSMISLNSAIELVFGTFLLIASMFVVGFIIRDLTSAACLPTANCALFGFQLDPLQIKLTFWTFTTLLSAGSILVTHSLYRKAEGSLLIGILVQLFLIELSVILGLFS
jgi:hypothetical protein